MIRTRRLAGIMGTLTLMLAAALAIPAWGADPSPGTAPASPPAEESDAPRAAPVEFTGSLAFGPCQQEPSSEAPCHAPVIDPTVVVPFTDPRLRGSVSILGQTNDSLGLGTWLWVGSFRIYGADGQWQEMVLPRLQHPDGTPSHLTSIFVGEGGYDGLYAISDVTVTGNVFDYHGWIIDNLGIDGVTDWSGMTRAEEPPPDE